MGRKIRTTMLVGAIVSWFLMMVCLASDQNLWADILSPICTGLSLPLVLSWAPYDDRRFCSILFI
jgi:hypothetical protein